MTVKRWTRPPEGIAKILRSCRRVWMPLVVVLAPALTHLQRPPYTALEALLNVKRGSVRMVSSRANTAQSPKVLLQDEVAERAAEFSTGSR